jgi:hypothetical protein
MSNRGFEWTIITSPLRLKEVPAIPSGSEILPNVGHLYSKDLAGVTNLFYMKDNGVEVQVTLTNPVTGTGTANRIAVWTSSSAIGANAALTTNRIVFSDANGLPTDDSALFWDNTNKRLGINHGAPETQIDVASTITTIARGIRSSQFSNDAVSANFNYAKSRGTTVGSHSAVLANDVLGNIGFQGSDGTSFGSAQANILGFAAENWSGSAKGTYLVLRTTPKTTTTVTEGLRLDDKENLVISSGLGALATNATDGFLYIPTSAGAPTGAPTAYTGKVAIEYDTTNNNFYVFNGAWKKVLLA